MAPWLREKVILKFELPPGIWTTPRLRQNLGENLAFACHANKFFDDYTYLTCVGCVAVLGYIKTIILTNAGESRCFYGCKEGLIYRK